MTQLAASFLLRIASSIADGSPFCITFDTDQNVIRSNVNRAWDSLDKIDVLPYSRLLLYEADFNITSALGRT